jgi:hypothetical protein
MNKVVIAQCLAERISLIRQVVTALVLGVEILMTSQVVILQCLADGISVVKVPEMVVEM